MEKEILYADSEKLINKLTDQGLIINNIDNVKHMLDVYGYSNLIKSYRDPFIYETDNGKKYRQNTSFEQIFSLYILDKNLRNAVISSMLDLEEYIKMSIAEIIAKDFGTNPSEYLLLKNYRNRNKKQEHFRLPYLIDKMKDCLNSSVPLISHYKEKYNCVPPWILFKSIYFSTMVNFIDCFKQKQIDQLINKLYPEITDDKIDTKMLLHDTLFMCNEYRNAAAHGARIYNYIPKAKIRYSDIFNNDKMNISEGISSLLYVLHCLVYHNPFESLSNALNFEIRRHCAMFPQDRIYLGKTMGIDILNNDEFQKLYESGGLQNIMTIQKNKTK